MRDFCAVLTAGILICAGCSDVELGTDAGLTEVVIGFRADVTGTGTAEGEDTKALNPDENLLRDINLFIFNENGVLEHSSFSKTPSERISLNLVKNCRYTAYACANLGYSISAGTVSELTDFRHYIAYPDDYRHGMAMSKVMQFTAGEENEVTVQLERLFAKVSLTVDRSRLDPGIELYVRRVKVGGCPKFVRPFSENKITNTDDMFYTGFVRTEWETDILNETGPDSRSGELTLYLLENLQGDLLPGNMSEEDKYFKIYEPAGINCSYVELSIEYLSENAYSVPGGFLIYRFYIGDGPSNFDVRRNTDHNIIITPSGDGLGEDCWRTDHENLGVCINDIKLNYTSLNMNYYGQQMKLEAYIEPENASEEMIYWYSTDEDVATVSYDGIIRAEGDGNCRIVCCATDGGSASAECNVTVMASPYYMKIKPGNYIRCLKGEEVTVSCEYFPPNAEFDIGIEELEYDKSRGIYDYTISSDGRSVTLKTLSKGSGLLYIEAGEPINRAELIVLVVD